MPETGVRMGWSSAGEWRPEVGVIGGFTEHRYREGDRTVAQGWVPWVGGRLAIAQAISESSGSSEPDPWFVGAEVRVMRDLRRVDLVVADRTSQLAPLRITVSAFFSWTSPRSDPDK